VGFVGRLGKTLHQTLIYTAVHDGMAVFGCPPSQFLGCRKECGVYLLICRTKNTYLHNWVQSYKIIDKRQLIIGIYFVILHPKQ